MTDIQAFEATKRIQAWAERMERLIHQLDECFPEPLRQDEYRETPDWGIQLCGKNDPNDHEIL